MAYLIQRDFNKVIQSDNLNQVIGGDSDVLASAIDTALEECKSYLVQRYDMTQEFQPVLPYDNTVAYKAKARVLDAGKLYSAVLPYAEFSYTALYNIGDKVFWKDKTYTCAAGTPVLTHGGALQYGTIDNLPTPTAPDDPIDGKTYWGTGTAYSVPAGTLTSSTTYYALGDTRSQMLVTFVMDIALFHVHSRIASRNIPDLRVKRYDEAIRTLKGYARGELTAAFPLIKPKQGGRIRYGGNIRNVNAY
jgi:phage gp36-like protein